MWIAIVLVVLLLTGIAYWFVTTDAPDGNYKDLRARGEMPPAVRDRSATGTFVAAAKDFRVWALFLVYAACFGVAVRTALYFPLLQSFLEVETEPG